jgi:cytoskeletal protein CcmA (bactofilin family)
MAYTLNYGKNSTNSLTVQDGQSGTVANLTFPGRNFSGYGSPVDQNFMLLAENFASANGANGPQYAIQGQMWYDTRQTNAVANSWAGLKVKSNNEDSSLPSWSQIVTFDTEYVATTSGLSTNPKHLTGLGNLQSNNLTVSNTSTLTGNVALGANLTVAGSATISGALNAPNLTLSGNLSAANISATNQLTALNANITGNTQITGNLYADGSVTLGTDAADTVTVRGTFVVTGPQSSTSTTSLTVSNPMIDLQESGTPLTGDTTYSVGVKHHYFSGSAKVAFSGQYRGNDSTNIGPKGTYIIADDVTIASSQVNTVNTWGTVKTGNIIAVSSVTSPAFNGILAATTGGTTNVTPSTNSITINGANTPTSATTAYGALDIPTGGVNIGANLRVGGTIFGKLAAVSTSAEPANLEYLKSAQSNITLANITTMVGTSVTLSSAITAPTGNFTNINVTNTTKTNVLLCNTAATVGSLTANTTVIATTGLTVSGVAELRTRNISTGAPSTEGTITGKWKLTTDSTLEATYSADLAERHHADANYPTGTVMTVGGSEEITSAQNGDAVLGVVSDAWAYLMNGGAGPQETHPAVAYCGRVPVRIVGPVNKHDRVSPFKDGVAVSSMANPFGWAIESNDDPGEKLVLCIIK